ncbi:unnamed protein product [Chrysoparadoxa australica]
MAVLTEGQPKPITVLRHGVSVQSVKFLSPDLVISGYLDGKLLLWSLRKRRPVSELLAHEKGNGEGCSGVLKVDTTQGKVMTQGRDGMVRVWDAETMSSGGECQPLSSIAIHSYHFCQFALVRWGEEGTSSGALDPGSALLTPCEEQGDLELWDLREPSSPCQTLSDASGAKGGMVMCCRLLQQSAHCPSDVAIAGGEDGSVSVFDLRRLGQPLVSEVLHKDPVISLDVGQDCRQGVSGGADEQLQVWRLDVGEGSITRHCSRPLSRAGVAAAQIRPDQRLLGTGGWDRRVRLFSWEKAKPLALLRCHEESVSCLDFCGGEGLGLMVAGSKDCKISCWNLFPS